MGFTKTLALVGLVMGLAVPAAQAAVRAGHSGWESVSYTHLTLPTN